MPQGRPKALRASQTGEKLYTALKLSGMSWGARVGPDHITGNERWAACGLPRSINTVIEDIRCGITLNRLDKYASFFQISAELLLDEGISPSSPEFCCAILSKRHLSRTCNPLVQHFNDAAVAKYLDSQNHDEYLRELKQLLSGIYDLYFHYDNPEVIYHGTAHIGEQREGGLVTTGCMVYEGVFLDFDGFLFRWHNFLHLQYLSRDSHVLGHMMTPDPMQSVIIRQRDPFYMKVTGLAGSLAASLEPDKLQLCVMRRPLSEGQDALEGYAALREAVVREPVIAAGDPRRAMILRLLAKSEP